MKPSTEWWRYLAPLAVIAIIALLPVPAGAGEPYLALLCRFLLA
ncbi:anion permease [Escherichia coli]|nr:anion permease [Escherichia coli]